jgi:integrase
MSQVRAAAIIEKSKAEHPGDLAASKVQAAIAALRDEGLALQTCNYYLRAIKQFSRWLWRDGRSREDVLAHLSGYNAQLDRRHDRRALTGEELARLIQAAEKGAKIRAMTGPERATLYHLAVGTGFRANELRNLVPESFDLDARTPTVTVQAAYSKHRRKDVQPIRRDLADVLRPWLAGKEAGRPVFAMPDKPIKLIRTDLDAAREAWVEEARSKQERNERRQSDFLAYRNSADRFVDFHALRHTYISRLVASGANIKVAQELARHSTPTLTLGRYAHVQLADQTRALDALPCINAPRANVAALAATGA